MFSTGTTSSGIPLVEGAEGNPEAALALVLRLMGHGLDFPGFENPTRLLVGRLPDPLPVPTPLPEGARVTGSQILGPAVTIVLDADQPPPAVLDFYKEKLQADGWTIQEPHVMHGGFMAGAFIPPLTYYKGTRGPSLSIQATAMDDGPTDVRLHLNTDPRQSFSAARMRHAGLHDLLPNLMPPPGMRQAPEGGGGGGSSYYSTARLRTDLDPAAVSTHYTAQLRAAGWTLTSESQGGPAAWSAWTFADRDGESWRGMLLMIRPPDPGSEYLLYLRADMAAGVTDAGGFGTYSVTSR